MGDHRENHRDPEEADPAVLEVQIASLKDELAILLEGSMDDEHAAEIVRLQREIAEQETALHQLLNREAGIDEALREDMPSEG